jgi:hypothetical protein
MEYDYLLKSGVGAVLGFLLAQLFNVPKVVWEWWQRPRLAINLTAKDCQLLSHETEAGNGETYQERIFGSGVRLRRASAYN